MNITFFNDIDILGGGEIWVLNMTRELERRGHRVSVVCPAHSQLYAECCREGIDLFGFARRTGMPFSDTICNFLISRNVDLLYCTVLGRMCEADGLHRIIRKVNRKRADSPAILMLKTGLPPSLHLNHHYYGFNNRPEIRGLHVVSVDSKTQFTHHMGLDSSTDRFIRVVYEGIDSGKFRREGRDREECRARFGLEPDQICILSASRLHYSKGQDNLLLAMEHIVKEYDNARLFIAGDGTDRQRLNDLSDTLGLGEHVRFLGHQSDVRPLLMGADIFCHPSLADGLPNSVTEAMAMELPILASSVGGIPEVIEHGKNGILIPPHDIGAIVKGCQTYIEHPELRLSYGKNAAETISGKFNFAVCADYWEADVENELRRFRKNPLISVAPRITHRQKTYPILYLMTNLRTGGEETELAIMAKYLDRTMYPMSVITGWATDEPAPAVNKLQFHDVTVDRTCESLPGIDEKVAYVVSQIRALKIRFLIACQNTALAYRVMQQLRPKECALIEHAGIVEEIGQIPKDRTAALVGVSTAITEAAAASFNDLRIRFIPSMIDPDEFSTNPRNELRSVYGFGKDVIIVFVGRLDAKKGVDLLIEAARTVLHDFADVRFMIVGPPDAFQVEYAQMLIDTAKRELPEGRFIFTGGREDIPQILSAADMCVLPSVGEGMSHVISEAGAAKLPVIAFNDGAANQQLDGGNSGILVAPGNISELTEKIILLVKDPQLRNRLGTTLYLKVSNTYSAKTVMPEWYGLFAELQNDIPPVYTPFTVKKFPEEALLDFPSEIQIETNTICNAKCVMCPYHEVSRELPSGEMSLDLYEKILAECAQEKTLWRLEPFLNNEPFTDPRMVDWISMAKQRVPHATVTVTTNGSLLTPEVADRLTGSGLDAIWFSFNGATRETYQKIMGLSYDRVKSNIEYLLSVRPPHLQMFINMIDTRLMSGEIEENIRYWQSRGIKSGSSPFVNRAGSVRNFDELNYRPIAKHPVRTCELVFNKMYIAFNGDVVLCCMDWRKNIVLGNARHQSLRDIWNGKRYRQYRRQQALFRADNLELCSACTYIRS